MKKRTNFLIYPLLLIGVFLVFANSCVKDEDDKNVPVLSTTEVTEITTNTAQSGGNIIDDGGITITVRGVCWNTNENPTIDDNKTENGTGAGSFTSSISGLEPNTTYYVRAYATNSVGSGFGSAISFTTQEGFTDPRDGKVYQTVVIGDQEWMAENLAYAPSNGNYWAYRNQNHYVATYGYLYDWKTALNVCPDGWHLPTDAEWTELVNYIAADGYSGQVGTALKSTSGWNEDGNGTDIYGFTALPGGSRYYTGTFNSAGFEGCWWTATDDTDLSPGEIYAIYWGMNYYYGHYNSYIYNIWINKECGFSVRCVKD